MRDRLGPQPAPPPHACPHQNNPGRMSSRRRTAQVGNFDLCRVGCPSVHTIHLDLRQTPFSFVVVSWADLLSKLALWTRDRFGLQLLLLLLAWLPVRACSKCGGWCVLCVRCSCSSDASCSAQHRMVLTRRNWAVSSLTSSFKKILIFGKISVLEVSSSLSSSLETTPPKCAQAFLHQKSRKPLNSFSHLSSVATREEEEPTEVITLFPPLFATSANTGFRQRFCS